MTLDAAWARRWIAESAAAIAAAKDELTELDRQIGDGDHGFNLDRGFRATVAKLEQTPPPADGEEEVGAVLKTVATTLMSTVGGAAGPLYGTAFLRAAKVTGRARLDGGGVVALLEAALEGIEARGKATPGEKTMVDAWHPAVAAAAPRPARVVRTTTTPSSSCGRQPQPPTRAPPPPSRWSRPRAAPPTSASVPRATRTRGHARRPCCWPPPSRRRRLPSLEARGPAASQAVRRCPVSRAARRSPVSLAAPLVVRRPPSALAVPRPLSSLAAARRPPSPEVQPRLPSRAAQRPTWSLAVRRPASCRSEPLMIALVLVSHSPLLAQGLAELAAQMAPDVPLLPAAGTADGGIGTSIDVVRHAVEEGLAAADGVVVLADLGSAVLTTESAIDLEDDWAGRVRLATAPFVEGTVVAAVAAQQGGSLDDVVAAAHRAGQEFAAVAPAGDGTAAGSAVAADGAGADADAATAATSGAEVFTAVAAGGAAAEADTDAEVFAGVAAGRAAPAPGAAGSDAATAATSGAEVFTAVATLRNPLGLHARPAAQLARAVADLGVPVAIGGVDGSSVLQLLALGATGGTQLDVQARGEGAREAVTAVVGLIESGFGEA